MSNKVLKAGKSLCCGCCGLGFKTWKGYQDQDQDRGYGICRECQGEEEERNEEFYTETFEEIVKNLKPSNAELARKRQIEDVNYKYQLVNKMIDTGAIQWKIGA